MGRPAVINKPGKQEKKSGVLNGKIEKKGKQTSSITKGIEDVKNKLKKEKKKPVKQEPGSPSPMSNKQPKLEKLIKQEPGLPSPMSKKQPKPQKLVKQEPGSPNKNKQKTETAVVSNSGNDGASVSKLEKKKRFKVKKAKNANKNLEAVTKVSSSPKAGKKSKHGKKGGPKGETPLNGSIAAQGSKKPKQPKTKEQEDKILERRKEKIQAWHNTIDLILEQKKIPQEEAALIRKSKKYDRLPLWKKNYVTWVKTDPIYKDPKFAPLIKKVYKVLKGAERKAAKTKRKTKQSVPEQPQLKAAIERCVQLTSKDSDEPAIKPVGKKDSAKQKKSNKDESKEKQDVKKLTESLGKKKKGKPLGKKKQ